MKQICTRCEQVFDNTTARGWLRPTCQTTAEQKRTAQRRATPDTHHRQLRGHVNLTGGAVCQRCHRWHTADRIEVHHPHRIADGGTDAQPLETICLDCHRLEHR